MKRKEKEKLRERGWNRGEITDSRKSGKRLKGKIIVAHGKPEYNYEAVDLRRRPRIRGH